MYLILTASSDTYITNKILNNSYRVTDANVGNASTLDLFKLYAESTIKNETNPIELSRILIKFDYDKLRSLTGSNLDIAHSSFKCYLKMSDVYGGQTVPSNFKVQVFPLSKSFDEGPGRDVVTFADLGGVNFITASVSGDTAIAWDATGSNAQGLLGSDDIDIIASGNLNDGNGIINLWQQQLFETGEEDLSIDITTLVSASLKDIIPDCGFRISFSGSHETDSKSRFVKRFASRHTQQSNLRPKIVVTYDDSTVDHIGMFEFDVTGSIFLNNYQRGIPKNILSGSAATEITGSDSLLVTLTSGSFSKVITGSQHTIGSKYIDGFYSASFAISQYESSLRGEVVSAASASFKTLWGSLDGSIGYHTGSLIIKNQNRGSSGQSPDRLYLNVTNLKSTYFNDQKVIFRTFIENTSRELKALKLPFESKSEVFESVFYQVRDVNSDKIIIPFHKNGTKLSSDADGMYFKLDMSSLYGGVYVFDFQISDLGVDRVFTAASAKFRVDEK
jgi:hypothetical protein